MLSFSQRWVICMDWDLGCMASSWMMERGGKSSTSQLLLLLDHGNNMYVNVLIESVIKNNNLFLNLGYNHCSITAGGEDQIKV